jgi:hypothetical protein
MITDYKILQENDMHDLERRVRFFLESGWLPAGGVSAHVTTGTKGSFTWYTQAVYYKSP